MFILSFIHVPCVVFNIFGTSMQYESNLLALTTLGNLGAASNVTEVRIPGCNEEQYHFADTCTILKNKLAFFYSILDAVGTIFIIIGWMWLRIFEKREVENLNRSTVNVSDYTISVTSIPPFINEREVAIHFANLTGEAVAEVNLAFQNSEEIQLYFIRGQLIRDRYKYVQRIRYELTIGILKSKNKRSHEKRLKRLMRDRERITALIRLKDKERIAKVNSNPKAIQVFVTFETEEGFVKAMSAYHQLSW